MDNGWSEWQNHVLSELERLSKSIEKMNDFLVKHIENNAREIATLKVKAGVWGIMGGVIPASIALIWLLIKALR